MTKTSWKYAGQWVQNLHGWGRYLLLLTALIFVSSTAFAQLTTADILGTVADSTGAIIPGANVTVLNVDTHDKRTAQSNASGDYSFNLLQPGHYSVTVQATGFKATTQTLAVEAGDRARADVHLEIGSESETVTVEALTPLLQADNATVSSTVSEAAVQDLPLNGRNFVQLVQTVPGANEGPGNGLTSGNRPDDRRQSSGFSVNGQDTTLNNYVIDGIDNNERIIGTIGVKPSVEGIQEISVQTNSYAPEAGRTAGGVVNIVTMAGSNAFHGSAYEYFRNDVLDSRNVTSPAASVPKAELRQNQFGGSIGGPIIKNKTFFFFDYEGLRQVAGGTTYTSTVPTLTQYDQINGLNGHSPQELINQGNGTAGLGPDPIALNYLKLFPQPNTGGPTAIANNYVVNPSKTQNSSTYDARVDHSFNSNNIFYGRYTYNKVDTVTPAALPSVNGIEAGGGRYNFSGPSTDTAQQWALNYTHIFNQNLLVDLKAAFTRMNNQSLPLNYGVDVDTQFGFGPNMNFTSLASGLTPLSISNFPDLGDGAWVPLQDIDNDFQYLGTVSYTHGNHNIKAGASLIRRQARNVQSPDALGAFSFGLGSDAYKPGAYTVDPNTGQLVPVAAGTAQTQTNDLASTLVGAMASSGRSYDLYNPDYRTWEPSFFAQDSWKMTPKLTIIYGVRYDVFTPYTEAHNRISNFDYNQALASTPDTVASALKVAGVNGVSETAGIATSYGDIAPRIGFSATLRPGLVLRGGYGLSFFPDNYSSNADLKNAPFISAYAPTCESTLAYNIQTAVAPHLSITPACSGAITDPSNPNYQQSTFDAGLPLPQPQTINSPGITFQAEDPKLKAALIQQFNLQVEKQFGPNVLTIGYVGNIGQHVPEPIQDINMPHPNDGTLNDPQGNPILQNQRPLFSVLPNVAAVPYMTSEAVSNYNALQTSFQRRLSHGLAFDANYTYSHALNDVVGFSEEGDQGFGAADPTQIRKLDYGNSEDDIRNRFALSLNYQIPFAKGFTGAKKVALDGWSINTISAWQGGKPFTVINNSADGNYSNRANPQFNQGADRPNYVKSNLPTSAGDFFNTNDFVPQKLGTIGTEARNQLYGPHYRHVDISIFKDFAIIEHATLQFRAEAFNISNTPSFFIGNTGVGNAQLGNASFGQITQADPNYTPRQIQFAMRVRF